MRIRIGLVSILVVVGVSACGSAGSPVASRPAPPAPVVVSADVGAGQIRVSPSHFGAGPILLTVTNQSAHAVALRVLHGAHAIARTAPINPQGVTQLKVDLSRGNYSLAAAPAGRRTDAQKTLPSHVLAARLRVGRHRPSSGASLLQP
jgi:hypothetical protein